MKHGFTLVELLCVLGLISIIFCATSKNIDALREYLDNQTFKMECTEILHNLRLAKSYALNHGLQTDAMFMEKSYIIKCGLNTLKRVSFNKADTNLSYVTSKISFMPSGAVSPYATTLSVMDSLGNISQITIKVGTFTIDFKKV